MIREWKYADASALKEMSKDVYQSAPNHYLIPDNVTHALACIKQYKNADHMRYRYRAVVYNQTAIGFLRAEKTSANAAEIGYYLSKDFRGLGLMGKALHHFIEEVKKEHWVHHLYARVNENNYASLHVLQANDFIFRERIDHIMFYVLTIHD